MLQFFKTRPVMTGIGAFALIVGAVFGTKAILDQRSPTH